VEVPRRNADGTSIKCYFCKKPLNGARGFELYFEDHAYHYDCGIEYVEYKIRCEQEAKNA